MKLRFVALFLTLITLLAIPVSAHSGKTDSNGGHYDQETGEYHYHHTYPAHQHYDMDGDGDIDCPYDFKEQQGTNSDNSSDKTSSNGIQSSSLEEAVREALERQKREEQRKADKVNKASNFFWLFVIILALFVFLLWAVGKFENSLSSGTSHSGFIAIMDMEILVIALIVSSLCMPGVGYASSFAATMEIGNILRSAFYLGLTVCIFWFFFGLLVLLVFPSGNKHTAAEKKIFHHLTFFCVIGYLYLLIADICGFISANPLYDWML